MCSDWEMNQQPFGPRNRQNSTHWAIPARDLIFFFSMFLREIKPDILERYRGGGAGESYNISKAN